MEDRRNSVQVDGLVVEARGDSVDGILLLVDTSRLRDIVET